MVALASDLPTPVFLFDFTVILLSVYSEVVVGPDRTSGVLVESVVLVVYLSDHHSRVRVRG
jgi:hypothetical protein